LYAYLVLIVFHALTRVLFPIGMFPVIMTISALVFFQPDWPRALVARVWRRSSPSAAWSAATPARPAPWHAAALALAGLYCAVQLAMPVRFLVYGGNVLWHEQGMRFSWRVMVRAKGGLTTFLVRNKLTGHTWQVSPDAYLTGLQESEMSSQPDLILQLAHHIRADAERRGLGPVEVHVDLSGVRDGLLPKAWVTPAPVVSPPHTRVVL
jgi:hypothetical protein